MTFFRPHLSNTLLQFSFPFHSCVYIHFIWVESDWLSWESETKALPRTVHSLTLSESLNKVTSMHDGQSYFNEYL